MTEPLTAREAQVARLLGVECVTAKAAAEQLGISYRTVEQYRYTIYRKLGFAGKQRWNACAQLARQMALEERR